MKATGGLGLAGRCELGAYRAAAGLYCLGLAARLGLPGTRRGEQRRLLAERLARDRAAPASGRRGLWLHAASVGEVRVAGSLLEGLRQRRPALPVLLTCNTMAGRAVAAGLQLEAVRYFPVDYPPVLRRFLSLIEPAAFLFVETEIWPGLLLELARRRVPSALVNGRISERSFPLYRRVRALLAPALATVRVVCARDQASRERLIALGARPDRTVCTGDMKLDAVGEAEIRTTPDLLGPVCDGAPCLLAISTREGEEATVLAAFEQLRRVHGKVRLVLAPRHRERAAGVLHEARATGLRVARWSRLGGRSDWDLLVVDTTGELRGFMKAALGAFVGASLVKLGGHNLLEPAAFKLPLVSGPYLSNVEEQGNRLKDCGALVIARDGGELAACWRDWLDRPRAAACSGKAGYLAVTKAAGALPRTLAALEPCLAGIGERGGLGR